jgi:hypothetical protein
VFLEHIALHLTILHVVIMPLKEFSGTRTDVALTVLVTSVAIAIVTGYGILLTRSILGSCSQEAPFI